MSATGYDENICGNDTDGCIVNQKAYDDYAKHADPLKDNLRRWEKGRLNRKTGERIPLSNKASSLLAQTLNPTDEYLKGFDKIKWDKQKPDGRRTGYRVRTNAIIFAV